MNLLDQTLSLEPSLQMSVPMPHQDEHLPDTSKPTSTRPALPFRVLIEKADHELVLNQWRGDGGKGIQRRGTRRFTFKSMFGEVIVQR